MRTKNILFRFHVVITFICAFPIQTQAQEIYLTKTENNYPPIALDSAYVLYDQDKNYTAALEQVEQYLRNSTPEDVRTYIAALELKFHLIRRKKGVGYLGALPLIEEAKELAKMNLSPDDILLSRVYKTYGVVYHRLGDFYRARAIFDTAIHLYNEAKQYDLKLKESILNLKFYSYSYSFGSIDTLKKYVDLRLQLEESKENPSAEKILYILQDYPVLYGNKGDYDRALSSSIRSYKFAKENSDSLLKRGLNFYRSFETYAQSFKDLMTALYNKRNYNEAYKVGKGLIGLIEDYNIKPSDYIEYYSLMRLMGQILASQENYLEALSYFNRALAIGTENRRDAIYYGRVLFSIGDCFAALGQTDEAKLKYENGFRLLKKYIDIPSSTYHNPYDEIGDFYASIAQYEKSVIYYDSALINSLPLNNHLWYEFPSDSTQTLTIQQLRTIGRKASSFARIRVDSVSRTTLLKQTLAYCDSLNNVLISRRDEFSASDGKLFLSSEFKYIYESAIEASYELLALTNDQLYFEKALKFSQLSKSILFLEQLAEYEKVNNNIISDSIKSLFGSKVKKLNTIESGFYRLLDDDITADSVVLLNDQLEQIRKEMDSLNQIIESDLLLANAKDLSTSFLTDLGNLSLDSDELLIEFFYGEEHIYIISFIQGKGSIHRVLLSNELIEALSDVIRMVSKPPRLEEFEADFAAFRNKSYYLFKELIKPVLINEGDIKRIVLVPDHILTRLPFEVLITRDEEKEGYDQMNYLIKDFEISYQLTSLDLKNYNEPIDNGRVLGLGFSENQVTRNFASLPGTEKEINLLKSSYPGTFINQASKYDFMNNARNFDIIHMAVHGLADTSTKYDSKLIFSRGLDNELVTSDLYMASLKAKLAVLSACQSGIGVIQNGEGSFSIARGFALAGVPSIVMTLWNVNDNVTSEMMSTMYQFFINDSENINSALRLTKLNYLEESDAYLAHPYYWAAFVQLGQNVMYKKSVSSYLWLFCLVPFLLMFFVIKKERKLK